MGNDQKSKTDRPPALPSRDAARDDSFASLDARPRRRGGPPAASQTPEQVTKEAESRARGWINGPHGWMHPAIRRPTPLERLQAHCNARRARETA